MYPRVPFQIAVRYKCFPALFAFKWFIPGMSPIVSRQLTPFKEPLETYITSKALFLFVNTADMFIQMTPAFKGRTALIAFKGTLVGV